MSTLSIQLFGAFAAQLGDQPITKFRTSKVQALFVFLVIENAAAVRRETLLDLLWPGLPQQSAQVNLRQTLYQLRKVLDGATDLDGNEIDAIVSEKRSLRLNPALALSADVHTFDTLLATNTSHSHSDIRGCAECRKRLEAAVDRYQGDLLNDFYLSDSNVFEEWAANQRAAYQRQFLDALSTLTTICLRNGQYAEAQEYAQWQLAHDNLHESARRQLMRALARSGQREAALAQFDQCRRLLRDELGMSPTQRTIQLAEQIAAGEIDLVTVVQTPEVRGYDLLEKLGSGAYGDVHRAYQPLINREVAVKIIKPEFANRPNFIRRFEVEAQTIAKLEHPYIVPLYDYWREPDGAFLVMRYMRGGNLGSELAQRGAWSQGDTLRAVEQIGAALTVAHEQGIVHRDLKPANILLDQDGNAYLSDFGIAHRIVDDVEPYSSNGNQALLTSSPYYTSPEQLLGKPVTPRSDIYTFGLLIYELLTGCKPYPDASVGTLLQHHLNSALPSVIEQEATLPVSLDAVLQRATATNPDDRFDAVDELVEQVRHVLTTDGMALIPLPALTPQIEGNPYKGLRAFQESDSELFFGRTLLINQLTKQLARSRSDRSDRFLAVVGPSGSGKSSVVKAGLIPALRQGAVDGSAEWFITEMVPSSHPLEELEAALLRIAVDPPSSLIEPLRKDERGLVRTLKRILPVASDNGGQPGQLLLIIDQFEELFTLVGDEARRQHFLNLLLTALRESRSQLRVVLTLRADFYDRPLQLPDLAELVKANNVVVTPLNRVELEETVTRPAALAGVHFENGLVNHIIDDVRDQPGMLPLLQYALTELYERREGSSITQAAYDELGGIKGVLGSRAEEIYTALSADDQTLAKQTFLRLVTLGEGVEDTRRRVLQSELEALEEGRKQLTENSQQSTVNGSSQFATLSSFGNARLLSFDHDPITRQPTVEVAHEALLREWPRLRGWLLESRDDLRLQRRLSVLTKEYQQADQDPTFLMHGGQLLQYENWADQKSVALTADERFFLDASIEARERREAEEASRQQRELEQAQLLAETERQRAEEQAASASRLRQRALLLAGALAIAGILAVAAFIFGQRATANANLAATREVEAQTQAIIAEENADLAATREIEALTNASLAATREAEEALARAEAEAAQATAQVEAQVRSTAEAIAIAEREEAQSQTRLATAREWAASALATLQEDPERSLMLALRSVKQVYTPEGEQILRQALTASRITMAIQSKDIATFVYSPDGKHLITNSKASEEGTVTLWDAVTGKQETSFTRPACVIDRCHEGMAVSPDGSLLALAGEDSTILIIDFVASVETGEAQVLHQLVGHGEGPMWTGLTGITFSPSGTQLASTSWDNILKMWDVVDGTLQYSVDIPALFAVGRPIFSPDGSLLTAGDISRVKEIGAQVFDAATGESLLELSMEPRTVSFTNDGKRLVGYTHELFTVWDLERSLETGEPVELYTIEFDRFAWFGSQQFNPNDSTFSIVGQDGNLLIWEVGDVSAQQKLVLSSYMHIDRSAYSPDGRYVATLGTDGIQLWDISPAGERELLTIAAHDSTIWNIEQSQDGSKLATAGWDGIARLWDAGTGEMLLEFAHAGGRVEDIKYSPDEKRLITAGEDRTVRVWDARTGEELAAINASGDGFVGGVFQGVMTVDFHPDGQQFAAGSADGTLRVWDANTYEQLESHIVLINKETGEPQGVTAVAYSPDGNYLAAAVDGGSGLLKIWDVNNGNVVLETEAGRRVWGIEFTPNSSRIIIDGNTEALRMWNIATGERLLTDELVGEPSELYDISPDGTQLLTDGPDNNLLIRDASDGSLLNNIKVPAQGEFSVDGSNLIIYDDNGIVRILMLDFEELVELAESRVTRTFSPTECAQYRIEPCPAIEE